MNRNLIQCFYLFYISCFNHVFWHGCGYNNISKAEIETLDILAFLRICASLSIMGFKTNQREMDTEGGLGRKKGKIGGGRTE